MKTLRRISILLILAIMISLAPVLPQRQAYAVGSAVMTMTPSRTIAPGVSTTIDIKIVASDFTMTHFDFTVLTDKGLELTGASGGTVSGNSVVWDDEDGAGEANITLYIAPSEDFTGNTKKVSVGSVLINGYYMATETVTTPTNPGGPGEPATPSQTTTQEVRKPTTVMATASSSAIYMASDNCELSGITIDGQAVAGFSPSITTYSLADTEDGYINVDAAVADERSKVSGTGLVDLAYGINRVNIMVTSEYGSTRTYTVSIKRKDIRSSDWSLSSLSVDVGKLNFEQNKYSFSVVCDHSVDSVTINATVTDAAAVLVSGTGKFPLEDGINVFPIIVRAENEKEKTYTVYVIRKNENGEEQKLSDNNALSGLSVSLVNFQGQETPLDIEFDPEKYEYVRFIKSGYDYAKVNATPADPTAVVEVFGGEGLMVGQNDIIVSSVSQDASSSEYLIRLVVLDETLHVRPSLVDVDIASSVADTVTIDLTEEGDYTVPFDTIRAVTLVNKMLRIDDYDHGILVCRMLFPSGADIIGGDLNAKVTFEDLSGSEKYASRTDGKRGKHVNFAHSGVIPSDSVISIYVGDVFSDDEQVYLYYFDPNASRFELVGDPILVKGGYIQPSMTHFSQYFVSEKKLAILDPKLMMIIGGGILLLALVIFIAIKLVNRKKKDDYVPGNEFESYDAYDEYYPPEERETAAGEMAAPQEDTGEAPVSDDGEESVREPVESKPVSYEDAYMRQAAMRDDPDVEFPQGESLKEEEYPFTAPAEEEKPLSKEEKELNDFLDGLDELFGERK
ncbi:MAG: cadherin-like beta sandwich domain-containing protein [Eubacteriaceae bacterium]|nr:cadherin-like beta sandwich domain-containing protein [Eubacteriaceae bacterium]